MKNKPTRHKDTNTFKFQPFSERISKLDIDIFHRVVPDYETEDESYFYQAIQKWNVLNLTESYDAFCKEVKPNNYITLPQLLLGKEHVIGLLLKHLKFKNPLCLQPLLEILVAVTKDLRKEFYDYYPQFLEILIELLNTKDTEQLEWTFTCLAYIFKFLLRPFIKNINSVFHALLPLLSDHKPDYINNFAAESFAFVARKVNDKRAFLLVLLKAVKNKPDGVAGCGKLLFEVVHGVNGQFHSCAENVLPFLLESLSDEKLPQSVLFEILEQVVANIVLHIQPRNSSLLWGTLLKIIDQLSNSWNEKPEDKIGNNLELILRLLGQLIEYRGGKFVENPAQVIQEIVKLLKSSNLPDDVLLTTCKITILLLLSKNVRLPQEQASIIIRKILNLRNKSLYLYFIDNIHEYSSFEALILPNFLKYCFDNNFDNECWHVLIKLILRKAPLCQNGINLHNWAKYPINFGSELQENKVKEIIRDHLISGGTEAVLHDLDGYFCGLACLPHLTSPTTELTKILDENLGFLLGKLTTSVDMLNRKKLLFLINNTLECLVHLSAGEVLARNYRKISESVLPLVEDPNYIVSLNVMSMLVAVLKDIDEIITMEELLRINKFLERNFSSPYHEIRLLTTHIYTAFDRLPEFKLHHSSDPDVAAEVWQIFQLCHRVESIEAHVHTYRDQLQNLEKLNFDKPQMIMCNQTAFKTIPLRYLCGTLYINFQLLWEPVTKIIETHAHGMDISSFWNVFGLELINVAKNASCGVKFDVDVVGTKFEFLGNLFQEMQRIRISPDFSNYRFQLWKALAMFADVAEAKTRDTSELLLNFINTEYTKSNSDIGLSCNIKENSHEEMVVDEDLNEETSKTDSDIIEHIKKELTRPVVKTNGKVYLKTLLQMLGVFSKVRSPLSMYREPELYKLYFDLLQHKNAELQKAALDCVMTYKHKYLIPYKDHLYNLVDEKNFKNEITAFRIDKESTVVLAEHRENLIPVVMQIVFSKMSAKTGLRTGGKASGQNRRNLVLRFLAGCQENEMLSFVEKAFRFYKQYLMDDVEAMVQSISTKTNLESFIPPKRLQSAINLLNVVLEQFGGLMGNDLLKYLLKIVLTIGATIKGAFQQSTNIHSGYLASLRNLRVSCIKIVERFFEHFDQYPWSNKEINAIFNTFVWPYLDKLNVEGIHSPTALLKLFIQWGSNPRYFALLVKYQEDNPEQYVLPHVVQLLLNEKSHGSVVNAIQEMIEKLLSLQADEEDLQLVVPVDNLLPVKASILERVQLNDKLNYGSSILLPHVPRILEKIKRKLQGKSKNLNQRELFILSRISELVWEAEISDQILQLLLPVLLKKCAGNPGEEVVGQFLTSIKNLLQNVVEPIKHIKQIAPLFAEVALPSGRKILIKILETTAARSASASLNTASALVAELNAWDAKWVDQPDFELRHNAFKKLPLVLHSENFDVLLGVILVYNCYFLIKNEKDLALRENSSFSLRQICPVLISKYLNNHKELDFILNETLFSLIRTGMKSKSDELRDECISLLGHLARECPDAHFILRDLHILTNKVDLEVDFFANLTHLQLHRRARALLKFSQVMQEQVSAVNPRTLTQFILPFASFYLCSEKYASKNSVVDAAIEAIGTVCRILPWHQYEGVLKFYLSRLRFKLDYQKQLVRLTVAILDAFHFDLTKGHHQDNLVEITEEKLGETIIDESIAETAEVDEVLDQNEGEIMEEEDSPPEDQVKACNKSTVLCKSTSLRVIRSIQIILLPQLHKSLAEMTQHDASHKVNRKKTGFEREEEDLLRVPISLAMVKLLQRLPKDILDLNLPGVFMKLCTFLRSKLDSVRRVARETLQKIMLTLGPDYLSMLLSEISPLLSRGYQVHVLVFTTHGVLNTLKEQYKPGDIDKVLITVVNMCSADMFGTLAEEKEIAKIAVKVSEARSTKSFDTFQILAQYITEKCLLDLILPIKKILETTNSFKIIQKAQDCLRHIAMGLVENTFVSVESLLKFSYGTAAEKIPQLATKTKKKLSENELAKLQREKPDCFIIPKIPGNRAAYRQTNVKNNTQTNAHVLIEFGVRLCHVMLKKDKVKEDEYKKFLDPFVGVFKNCLNSKHVKLSTLTLQCLCWIMKYELPSMQQNIKPMAKDIFSILHKYASAGLSKGDNFDLVVAAFKAMAVLVRHVNYYTIDVNQLKVLLLYVEQDMHDYDRQATAFSLLKAIIARKLIVPEIHDIMKKVAELSVMSELDHVRTQSRIVFHQFLMDYPVGKTLEKHVGFYISQMSYEMQFGRESAIEMVHTLINSFPMKVLIEFAGTFIVTLSARLVNDEVPECRKKVAECITSMLTKLPKKQRDPLFDIVILWLKDKNRSHRRLAAQLCGFFVTVEKSSFDSRLNNLMPQIMKQFGLKSSGKINKRNKVEKIGSEEQQRVKDHHLFQVLQLLLKISSHCPTFLKQKDHIQNLALHMQTLLGYPHDWVRLGAAQFLGFVLSETDIEHLASLLAEERSEECGYLCIDPPKSVKSLTLDLCDQLQPGTIKSDLAEQVIKNLVFVARVLQKIPPDQNKINLLWLTKRMRKIVNTEVVETSSSTILRMEVFKWVAAVGTALELENVLPVLPHLLAPLVREMITTEEKNAPLRQLAKEAAGLLRKRVGMDVYTSTLSKLEQNLLVRRSERKRSRVQLAVTDPELHAKKKIKRHEKKKKVFRKKV